MCGRRVPRFAGARSLRGLNAALALAGRCGRRERAQRLSRGASVPPRSGGRAGRTPPPLGGVAASQNNRRAREPASRRHLRNLILRGRDQQQPGGPVAPKGPIAVGGCGWSEATRRRRRRPARGRKGAPGVPQPLAPSRAGGRAGGGKSAAAEASHYSAAGGGTSARRTKAEPPSGGSLTGRTSTKVGAAGPGRAYEGDTSVRWNVRTSYHTSSRRLPDGRN